MKPCGTAGGQSLKAMYEVDSLWWEALKSQLQFAVGKARLRLFPCKHELWVRNKPARGFGTPQCWSP